MNLGFNYETGLLFGIIGAIILILDGILYIKRANKTEKINNQTNKTGKEF